MAGGVKIGVVKGAGLFLLAVAGVVAVCAVIYIFGPTPNDRPGSAGVEAPVSNVINVSDVIFDGKELAVYSKGRVCEVFSRKLGRHRVLKVQHSTNKVFVSPLLDERPEAEVILVMSQEIFGKFWKALYAKPGGARYLATETVALDSWILFIW